MLESRQVTLSKKGEDKGVRLSFGGFPYLIVWSKPEGDFVAVEPWGGLSTCSDEDDVLEHKRGCLSPSPRRPSFARSRLRFCNSVLSTRIARHKEPAR